MFYGDPQLTRSIGGSELIKIKFEVDTNPPDYATFETKYRLLPLPYEVSLYDMPSLFAGKVHAVLCRSWKNKEDVTPFIRDRRGLDVWNADFFCQITNERFQ